jgi:hypothetical protein
MDTGLRTQSSILPSGLAGIGESLQQCCDWLSPRASPLEQTFEMRRREQGLRLGCLL